MKAVLAHLDALMNRLYGWRYNPLYQSGALVVALLAVVSLTGIYLLFFYRIGSPYASVVRIEEQVWLGRWIRALHRYASDAAVLAAAVHAFRLFVQNRSWGPRALAWVSGVVLFGVILICGWTGYVMVWDTQGQVLAAEGARLLDVLPIFSEPIGRMFVGERELPSAFFFLNLFLHVALPIGLGAILWLHVSRVARAVLLPPRGLMWGVIGLLLVLSIVWPVGVTPPGDLLSLPERAPYDLFYSFWIPVTERLPAGVVWLAGGLITIAIVAVPWLARPRPERRPEPSQVDERRCTGCEQCALDCPYEAITMVPRARGAKAIVALVDPSFCVSCGICAGSCAPMGVGPPDRTGRDQLVQMRRFLGSAALEPGGIVAIVCDRTDADVSPAGTAGALVYPVACGGSAHTSVIEGFLRAGAGGVLVVACPPRNCWNREGPKWLEQRMYHDREAELKERVDRNRVALLLAGGGEGERVRGAVEALRARVATLAPVEVEGDVGTEECEGPVEREVNA